MSGNPVDLEAVVRKLHSDVEQILGVVKPLMQDVALRGLQADRVEESLTRLEAEQRSTRVDFMDELGKTRSDLMERMNRLQNRPGDIDERGWGTRIASKANRTALRNKTACWVSR
jgi:hypothetical protein